MLKFFLVVIFTAVLLLGFVHAAIAFTWIAEQPSFLYPTLILLTFATVVIFKYLYKITDSAQFVQFYLLLMVVKLVAYLCYNLLIVLEDRQGAVANVTFFLLVYLVFTAIEIVFLYRHVTANRGS